MFIQQKRGQLTVFILIGIFLLASTAVFLYLKKDRTALGLSEVIPPEFQPVKDYVEECLQKNLQSGILLMGTQGGYIYFPERIANNPDSTISFSRDNPIKVPYWQYRGQIRVPTIQHMEKDLSDYVLNNLNECLHKFSPFEEKFTITEIGKKEAKVTIGETDTVITLIMPIEAKTEGSAERTRITLFDAQVPVQLRKMHQLAADIFDAAAEQQFFEDLTIELMTVGPQIPFSDISLSCKRPKWKKSSIAAHLKELIYYNLPRVRFSQANYPPFLEPLLKYEQFKGLTAEEVREGDYPKDAPEDLYEFYHFFFPAADERYPDFTVGAYYEKTWALALNARPSDGDNLVATGGRGDQRLLQFLCIQSYHFTYDVEYPIQIVIRDPTALGGFTYRYALPVRITSNAPDHGSAGVAFFNLPSNAEEYCAEQREEEAYLYAKDANTRADLSGVNITFNCLNQFTCDLGSTGFDGNTNRLRVKLPAFCKPGELIASHPDYLDARIVLENPQYGDLIMLPLYRQNFRVVKRTMADGNLGDIEFLDKGERAAIFLYLEDREFSEQREYPTNPQYEELSTLPLIGSFANYTATLALFDEQNEPIGGWVGTWAVEPAAPGREVVFTVIETIPHPQTEEEQKLMLLQLENSEIQEITKPTLR